MSKICKGSANGVKKNMEFPGGWGGPPTTLWNGNSRGVEGLKLKNHPWGGMDIFWNHTFLYAYSHEFQ